MLALLELPTGTMTRRELLRVMTHPAVIAGHPHVHVEDWVRWTERLGIVHGADARAHAGTYLVGHANKFHWDQGVRRLALGAYMVGADRGPDRGAVMIDGLTVAPEEVRPEQQASAATYALLVRSLCADAAWLAQHEATLAEWADVFVSGSSTPISIAAALRDRASTTPARGARASRRATSSACAPCSPASRGSMSMAARSAFARRARTPRSVSSVRVRIAASRSRQAS